MSDFATLMMGLLVVAGVAGGAHANDCSRQATAAIADNPRLYAETPQFHAVGIPEATHGAPDTETIAIWQAGEAQWSHDAAMIRSGAVSIVLHRDAAEICLRSPSPHAYGGFGAQIAAAESWLAVLESKSGRVYLYNLDQPTRLQEKVFDSGAQSLAMTEDNLLIGSSQGIRILVLDDRSREAADVPPAPDASVFSGRMAMQNGLLVWANPAPGQNDGLPTGFGRVDVFRKADGKWRWEQRLVPEESSDQEAFGSSCCVDLRDGRVVIRGTDGTFEFTRGGGQWRQAVEETR
ncbi:hypothetical protein [Rhizobium sp. Leaf383]|uniref:hypothetical protein n=1 Tax=Rhizobium sp. Leaf383 TaxID=1736357 RepID=UPI000714BF13|nr:hypothetical protein [Rhizobium sp. Leaf383]KQS75965.1 hypothetical protein ASG58_14155 [Rhizobium sp. Leaf383]